MKKTILCWLILICSTFYSQSRITTSKSSKTQSNDKAKDKSGITTRKVTQKADDVIEVVSDNIGNDYENKYFFRGFGTSKEPSIILTSSNGTTANPLNLDNNDFIGSIHFSPMVSGTINILGGSSINSYYRGDGTTLLSDLIFRTSNGERMRIDPTGKVGIGTVTPTSILDLGPSHGTSPTDVLGKKLTVYNNESGTSFYGLGSSTGILQFHAASTPAKAPEMVLSSIGYVGIGTTTPSTVLDLGPIIGSNPTNVLGKKLAVYNDAAGNDFYGLGTSKDILQFHSASTPAEAPGMVLSSSGKVGIGTTTPSNVLDLGPIIGIDPNDAVGKKLAVYNNAAGTNFYGLGTSSGILQFHAGSVPTKAPGMVLNSTGNLGIGTLTPLKKLDVEGAVRISQTQADNLPNNLASGTNKPLYVNTTDGTVRYAPDGYTRVSGGFRPGGNALIATFPRSNTLARIRFVHYVNKSDNNNNGNKAAYSYGDFTIIGTDTNNPIAFVDVVVKGYDGKPRAFTSTNTSISWSNGILGTTTILLDQTTAELRVTNTNTVIYSYFFEILGGI